MAAIDIAGLVNCLQVDQVRSVYNYQTGLVVS